MDGQLMLPHVEGAVKYAYLAVMREKDSAKKIIDASVDIKTIGDVSSKEAFIAYFRQSRLPIKLFTEELDTPISFSENPIYSAVGDEVDGTYNMAFGLGMLPHGSVIGIAEGANPKFEDFVCSAFLEFNSGNLFYAVKGQGAYLINGWAKGENERIRIKASNVTDLEKAGGVSTDVYMLGKLASEFASFTLKRGGDFRSTAVHLALVASGSLDMFILGDNCVYPNKRRTGEEIGPLYLLVKEAGGSMLDWRGNDLGPAYVGLDKKVTFHAIVSATKQLGLQTAEFIKNNTVISEYLSAKRQ